MKDHPTPDDGSSSDDLLEELRSADPAEAPELADSLAASLATDLAATAPLTPPDGPEETF